MPSSTIRSPESMSEAERHPERAAVGQETPNALTILRASEHGLPFLAPENQRGWIGEGFENLLWREFGTGKNPLSSWMHPAIRLVPASNVEILDWHPDAIPGCLLAVWHVPLLGPIVAPWYEGFDPATADWRDADRNSVRTQLPNSEPIGQSLGAALRSAWHAFDRRSLTEDGGKAGPRSEGAMRPAPTIAPLAHLVGKGSRRLGVGRGVLRSAEFADFGGDDLWPDVKKAARRLTRDRDVRHRILDRAGLSERALQKILAKRGGGGSWARTREAVTNAVTSEARARLLRGLNWSGRIPASASGVLAAYLASPDERSCRMCGRPLSGRKRSWCSEACRKRASRTVQLQLMDGEG